MKPNRTSFFRRSFRTFGEIPGIACWNTPGRIFPLLKLLDHTHCPFAADDISSENDLWKHTEWLKNPAVNSEIIQAMDASGDGQIQRDEWWWGDDFTGFGSDQNGILNKGELAKIPTASARLTPTELRSRTRWMQRIILYISIFFGIIHAL